MAIVGIIMIKFRMTPSIAKTISSAEVAQVLTNCIFITPGTVSRFRFSISRFRSSVRSRSSFGSRYRSRVGSRVGCRLRSKFGSTVVGWGGRWGGTAGRWGVEVTVQLN